jgi:hypothetical protein
MEPISLSGILSLATCHSSLPIGVVTNYVISLSVLKSSHGGPTCSPAHALVRRSLGEGGRVCSLTLRFDRTDRNVRAIPFLLRAALCALATSLLNSGAADQKVKPAQGYASVRKHPRGEYIISSNAQSPGTLETSGSRIGFGSWIFSGAWCSWSLGGLNLVQAIPTYCNLLKPLPQGSGNDIGKR